MYDIAKGSLLSVSFLSLSCVASAADLPALDRMPANAQNICPLAQDTFDASWASLMAPPPLTGQTLMPPLFDPKTGMAYIFPPDGPNFSDAGYDPTNCAFFGWSEQMFLWVTSPIQFGEQLFDKSVPAGIVAPDSSTNYVFSSEFFYRLDSFTTLQPQTNDGSPDGNMSLRSGKSEDADTSTVGQAGRTNGVLFSHGDTPVSNDSSLVYYEIYASRPYGYVRDALLNDAPSPYDFTEFPTDVDSVCTAIGYGIKNGFVELSGGVNAAFFATFCKGGEAGASPAQLAALGGDTPPNGPQLEVAVDYLAMAVELKAAWVEASTLANPGNYFLQEGSVPNFVSTSDANTLVQDGHKTVTIALVGLHIVGTVNGHPEMVWATFEHIDNAPNATYFYLDTDGNPVSHSDIGAGGSTDWLLSDGTDAAANTEYAIVKTDTGSGGETTTSIVATRSNRGQAVTTPTNVNRLNPWGSPATEASAEVNSQMISTNVGVLNALSNFYLGADGDPTSKQTLSTSDPRFNYIMTGSSWGDSTFPTGNDVSQIVGTPAMANMTMETFTQSITDDSGDLNGCFTCHGIREGSDKFGVSHVFEGIETVNK